MYRKHIKRALDVIISIVLIIILLPLFIFLGIVTYLSIGRPIILTEKRIGKKRKKYTIYKFRTMNFNYRIPRKKRMTKVTSFLDKYKFNELLQLFNVLKGDMSLVGPRPFKVKHKLDKDESEERYKVRPGMTGLAQIKGTRYMDIEKKLDYDAFYSINLSFLLDLKIIFLTPIAIIKMKK